MKILNSHRKRLTVGAAGLFGVILAIFFVLSWFTFTRLQANDADRVLTSVLEEVSSDTAKPDSERDLERVVQGNRGVSVRIFNSDGREYDAIGSLPLQDIDGKGVLQMDKELVRYESRKVRGQNIVVGLNWEPARYNSRQFGLLLVLIWFPLVGLVGALAWASVGRTFEPLLAMAAEAERLSGADLSKRLPRTGEAEFASLTDKLNSFLARLEASIVSEDQFIADAAHELRTPLTIMRGQFETTLLKERTADQYRSALRIGVDEAQRMSELLEMLLSTARTHPSPTEPIEISGIVLDVVERWEPRFLQKNIKLEASIKMCWTRITRAELESVLENLVSNALRYSQQGGDCQVTIANTKWVEITVEDRGAGIAAEDRERIFERFVRLEESRSRETGGFGIGLAVVQRIVVNREGSVEVLDREGGGSKFVVRLPRSGPPSLT